MTNKKSSIFGQTFAGVKVTRNTLREPKAGKFGIYEVTVGKTKSAILFGATKAFRAALAIAKAEYPKAYEAMMVRLAENKPTPKKTKKPAKAILTPKEATTLARLLKKAGVKVRG
jgi:hypothetical protein